MAGSWRRLTKEQYGQMAAMLQQGKTQLEVAETLGCSRMTVSRFCADPVFHESLEASRAAIKKAHLLKGRKVVEKAWQMAEDAAGKKDPRGFKDTMDGIRALEQVTSQAAGEKQGGDTVTPVQVNVNMGELLRQVFADVRPKAIDAGSPDA